MVPNYILQPESKNLAVNVAAPIPISAVRLVHPMRDPATGHTRDVVIRELKPVDIYYDRPTRRTEFNRLVPVLNVQIPWPPKEEPQYVEHPADTLRIDVEAKTFVPTLLRGPLPDGLIDELRGRFSRFRTRHEPEYLARKEAEAAEKAARHIKLMAESMRTPLQEFHMHQRALRRARGQPELSDDMLVKIGEIIARNRERMLGPAGAEAVASPAETAAPPPPPPSSGARPESQPPPS